MTHAFLRMIAAISLSLWASSAAACLDEPSCLIAYAQAVIERDQPADFELARQSLRRGCETAQTGESCAILSTLYARRVIPNIHEGRTWLNLKGCRVGNDTACNFLASEFLTAAAWEEPRLRIHDNARAAVEADCADGNDFACRSLVRYINTKDAARYQTRCDAGERVFCSLLGGPFHYPYFTDREATGRAEDIFRAECSGGEPMACLFLADLVSSGNVRDFFETARPHYLRACELGAGHGCDMVHAYLIAQDTPPSVAEQLTFLRPSCDLGSSAACLRIAYLQRWDDDAARIRYAKALHRDCLAGGGRSCESAAENINTLRYQLDLDQKYGDVDQHLDNYFTFGAVLLGQ